jgi:hypothetical protein
VGVEIAKQGFALRGSCSLGELSWFCGVSWGDGQNCDGYQQRDRNDDQYS